MNTGGRSEAACCAATSPRPHWGFNNRIPIEIMVLFSFENIYDGQYSQELPEYFEGILIFPSWENESPLYLRDPLADFIHRVFLSALPKKRFFRNPIAHSVCSK